VPRACSVTPSSTPAASAISPRSAPNRSSRQRRSRCRRSGTRICRGRRPRDTIGVRGSLRNHASCSHRRSGAAMDGRSGVESSGEAEEKSVTGDARIIRAGARAQVSLATLTPILTPTHTDMARSDSIGRRRDRGSPNRTRRL